ncbi:MAG: ATP-dependent endonuclease [Flavobacteriia bacterium]|nr:MAG: ATP-dependent endonuclease [Flavobacteriia bacterium]
MIKAKGDFYKSLIRNFQFTPTLKQNELFLMLSDFVFDAQKNGLFLLKGYAGTGKTSVISTLVNNLWQVRYKSVLLAPTGRAAKVISKYSGRQAFTIHKKIYYPKKASGGGFSFTLQENKHTHTLFIIDEASMIPDASIDVRFFESRSLLDDLISYVYSGKNCKLILIGDTAQLPPVKLEISPALDRSVLEYHYSKLVYEIELTEVMRQHSESGVLQNATKLRNILKERTEDTFKFNLNYKDIIRLTERDEILDAFYSVYDQDSVEDTVLIVRSNKRANLYNQQIRNHILDRESEITTGDFVMVVKNNYFWLKDSEKVGFIANGDICEILEIFRFIDLYGFRFAEVKLRMVDYPDQEAFETVILLNTLHSESPSLTFEESNKLYHEVAKDYVDLKSKYKIMLAIKSNKYFNALQVKFSYAMTCHKTQGGQWKNIFIEQPYLPDRQNNSYLRWLYTAVTRTQEKLYLIGFKEEYFEE